MPAAQKISCVVDQIVPHGEHVYTIVLRPDRRVPQFRAGQFLHLALDPYAPTEFWPESRVFSIASSPVQRDALRITYSVQGAYSRRMERELEAGRRVWVKLPYGDFVIETEREVVLFAGGTGITAFTAFLAELGPEAQGPVTLAYGARTDRLLIYRDVVEQCAKRVPTLSVLYFAEQTETGVAPNALDAGQVSVAAVWPRLRQPSEAHFYISGPPQMLRAIDRDLRDRNVPAEAIHIDAWE